MRSASRLAPVALIALFGLSACATYNPAYGGLPFPFPGDDGYYGRDGDYGDYGRTSEWRRVDRDAAQYANQVDRAIGLSSSEERAVARVVRDRTHQLLRRTHPRSHREVYPFPRGYRNDRWWDGTDRAVERVLSSRNRREYRAWARGDYYDRDGYYNDGRYDDRYRRDDDRYRRDDEYRGRRYEERDRGDDRRDARVAGSRNPLEILRRQQQEEARRRQADEQRREQARREETRRRDEARRRQADEQRREQARREAEHRGREQARREDDRRREAPARRGSDSRQRDDDRRGRNEGRRDADDRSDDARENDERRSDRGNERSAERRARPQRGN